MFSLPYEYYILVLVEDTCPYSIFSLSALRFRPMLVEVQKEVGRCRSMAILKFDLVADEKARNRAIVKQETYIHPGEIVLRVEALATALLPEFKARRCDWCLRTRDVKACSKCKEVYYCDRECMSLLFRETPA